MSKSIRKLIGSAAPLTALIPGVGLPLAAALGAGGGLLAGGGLKGALAGGLGAAALGGGGSILGGALGASGATANAIGSGILGAGAGGLTGGLKGALLGGAAGGLGGYASSGGFDGLIGDSGIGDTAFGRTLGLDGTNNTGTYLTAGGTPTVNSGVSGGASSAYDTNLGSAFDDSNKLNPLTNLSSPGSANAGTFLGNTSTANPILSSATPSLTGSLMGSSGSSSLTPILSSVLGSVTNQGTEKALLAQQQKNAALFEPYLNAKFTPGDLTQDPGYQFDLAQGTKALDRKASASGNYFSGEALTDATKFGTGLADKTYNDAYQRFLSQNAQNLNAAGAAAGVNTNIGNIQGGAITNEGNLLAGSGAALLGGTGIGNTGALLGTGGDTQLIGGQLYKKNAAGQWVLAQ